MVQQIHDEVRRRIDQGLAGYAQGQVKGELVSLHPSTAYSRPMTTNATFLTFREAVDAIIDGTVRGTASASPGTFTKADYERRADYHELDYAFAHASDEDKAFARALRRVGAHL